MVKRGIVYLTGMDFGGGNLWKRKKNASPLIEMTGKAVSRKFSNINRGLFVERLKFTEIFYMFHPNGDPLT